MIARLQVQSCVWFTIREGMPDMNDLRAMEVTEHIDRLMTVDFHTRRFIIDLYNATRAKMGGVPLTFKAAKTMLKSVEKGSTVAFLVGFPTFGTFVGEQDGPVGAAMLSRALSELLDVKIVVMTDKAQSDMVKNVFAGAGFSVIGKIANSVSSRQIVVNGIEENKLLNTRRILDELHPSAIITIERPSRNMAEKYMSMNGIDLSSKVARLDDLIPAAMDAGITTIGIADGGNEVGCGLIKGDVIKNHPNGEAIASNVSTDLLIFASISNLGAYGLAGAVSAISSDLYILPDKETLERTLLTAANSGLHNGPPLWLDPGTDGIPCRLELFFWECMGRMIWEELNPHFPKFY